MTFNGLDPAKTYAVTLSANRDNPAYAGNRWAQVTIDGVDASSPASSAGVEVYSDTSVSFAIGDNSANGYVARWVDIDPGADGEFTVTSVWDQTQGVDPANGTNTRGYAMAAFKLETYSEVDTTSPVVVVTTPPNGAVYSRGEPVTVDYACGDFESGIDSCVGTAADGSMLDTSSFGTGVEFTVTAVNGAGLPPTVVTHTYDVVDTPVGVDVLVSQSSDDAEEDIEGTGIGDVDAGSSDLEFVRIRPMSGISWLGCGSRMWRCLTVRRSRLRTSSSRLMRQPYRSVGVDDCW